MNYQLMIRPEAQFDIEDAFEWYDTQDPKLGSEFVRAVDTGLSTIARNPLAYPILLRQARRVRLKRFPYALFYIIDTKKMIISIVSCFHGNRDPNGWQDRLLE
jgi:plasmid stabilization system protein ParE